MEYNYAEAHEPTLPTNNDVRIVIEEEDAVKYNARFERLTRSDNERLREVSLKHITSR